MIMRHLDVTIAFLESKVNEEIDVILLKGVILLKECLKVGFDIQVHARLLKSLYGLKNTSLNQFETVDDFL